MEIKNERGYLRSLRSKYADSYLIVQFDDKADMNKHKEVTLIGISDNNSELFKYQRASENGTRMLVCQGSNLLKNSIGGLQL